MRIITLENIWIWLSISSRFDSNILQLHGIPGRILLPAVTKPFSVKMTPFFSFSQRRQSKTRIYMNPSFKTFYILFYILFIIFFVLFFISFYFIFYILYFIFSFIFYYLLFYFIFYFIFYILFYLYFIYFIFYILYVNFMYFFHSREWKPKSVLIDEVYIYIYILYIYVKSLLQYRGEPVFGRAVIRPDEIANNLNYLHDGAMHDGRSILLSENTACEKVRFHIFLQWNSKCFVSIETFEAEVIAIICDGNIWSGFFLQSLKLSPCREDLFLL